MRVEIVTCDRCRREISRSDVEGAGRVAVVKIVGQTRRDLCLVCVSELEIFLRGVPVLTEEQLTTRSEDHDQLVEVRRIANRAIEQYADGASADDLIAVIRDVATGARRR
jgi:hypothetical protein